MTLLPARTMIYVMRRKGGLTKIGVSDNPKRRRADLGGGAELVWHSERHHMAYTIERALQMFFKDYRHQGEWFFIEPAWAIEAAEIAIHFAYHGVSTRTLVKVLNGDLLPMAGAEA
jgi:hypothetical protein